LVREEGKGNELTRQAFALLKELPINFVGNVEGRDLYNGRVDVIACDGFVGNVALKISEGLVEAVRVSSDRRGEKIGEAMFAWVLEKCRSEHCGIVQLTTDKSRTDAHRFYDRLGFEPSHIGYKMMLA